METARVLSWISLGILFYMIALNLFYTWKLMVSASVLPDRDQRYWFTKGIRLSRKLSKPISILVPAYNEETNIIHSVKSFLSLNYENYEVIVSNDGSKDGTMAKLIAAFELVKVDARPNEACDSKPITAVYFSKIEPKLVVVDKENGGKADAQNAAARVARFPYLCVVDADTLLDKDSLSDLAIRFAAEPTIVALGGIVRVVNGCVVENSEVTQVGMPRRFIERIQVLEYLRAFLFGRVSLAAMNALLLISGAFGVFRRDAFAKIRGWNRQAIGEDMDAVVRIHRVNFEEKLNWKVDYLPHPISWTQVPPTWASLAHQRERWQRGLMQVLFANMKMLLNPRYGSVGLIGIPHFFLLEMPSALIEIACYPLTLLAFALGAVNVAYMVYFLALVLVWGLCISFTTVLLHEDVRYRYRSSRDLKNLLWFALFENIGYRQIRSGWRLWGMLKYFFVPSSRSSGLAGWTAIQRASFTE
jgi:cellulose synthase/poly-beta-1,6-N-acetylglucosamine synthase-like glycosyltransferase